MQKGQAGKGAALFKEKKWFKTHCKIFCPDAGCDKPARL
jgi:hypothetical protein